MISKAALHLVCFSFVDDTDLVNVLKKGDYDIDKLISETQQALDYWHDGLKATGGTLVPIKSYWHLIDFKCSKEGKWTH